MADITIGGTKYYVPEMNFLAMERAWPYIQEATETLDPMKGASTALAVFAAAIMEGEEFNPEKDFGIQNADSLSDSQIHTQVTHFFKKKLKGTEVGVIRPTMFEVLKEAGLEVTEGEALMALQAALGGMEEDPSPSMGIAQSTSPSSSPQDARVEAGTA